MVESETDELRRLRAEVALLRQVIDHVPFPVFWKDTDFAYLGGNAAFLADAGTDNATLTGSTDFELSWAASGPLYRADDAAVLERDTAKRGFEEPMQLEQQRRWVRTSKAPLHGPGGAVIGLVGCYEDITERWQAQERNQAIVRESNDAIFVATAQGHYVLVNPAACRLLGYSEDELLGTHFTSILAPGEGERLPVRLNELHAGRKLITERFFLHRDGHTVPVELSSTLLPSGHILAMVRDLSERHHQQVAREALEQELLHAQKLESVGRLAGGVAHDFNNMLTVILNSVYLAKIRRGDPSVPTPHLDAALAASERAATLTRHLLAFSRKQVLAPVSVDLRALLTQAEPLLRSLLGQDIQLELRLPKDLNPVLVDPGKIEQVVINLVRNAHDAMPDGGALRLAVGQDDDVWLSVSDDGVGMDAATRERVFEPFFTTKQPGQGTGLGLSMVFGVVRQAGGYITVTSEPGLGTTFVLRFPPERGPVEGPKQAPEAPELAGITVLVVEDEPDVAAVIDTLLRSQGHRVLLASSAEQGLDLLHAGLLPTLVLADVVMPGMSGAHLDEELRRSYPKLPLVLMSAYAERLLQGSAARLPPGRAFLAKPFTPDELFAALEEVLPQRG